MKQNNLIFQTQEQDVYPRLDMFLASHMPSYSRTFLQKLIETGYVSINEQAVRKASTSVKGKSLIRLTIPEPLHTQAATLSQISQLAIERIHEEEQFLVINKPPFLAVHKPAHTSTEITLIDWLRAHVPSALSVGDLDRPGIIHRLDKDTSGLLIIAKDPRAHAQFSTLFQTRSIQKQYLAVVKGHPPTEGVITYNITRHPTQRVKMKESVTRGKAAYTQYRVKQYLHEAALIELLPTTGRTHQLRVHCAAITHPIVGDAVYGTTSRLIDRQALHAAALSFTYDGKLYQLQSQLPQDMHLLIEKMQP